MNKINAISTAISEENLNLINSHVDKLTIKLISKVKAWKGSNNIEPIITLHHFTLPLWMDEMGSWENKDVIDH